METESKATNVYLKISKVMGDIGQIVKDDNGRYQSFTIDAVAAELNPVMAEHKLLIIPSVREVDKTEPTRHTIYYDMNVIDAESGDSIVYQWIAEAILKTEDNKPYGNAHSYAMKYFCLRLFMISAADDPDPDSKNSNGQKSSKSGYSGKKTTGQNGGQKTSEHWSKVQANIDFVKSEGQKIKTTFGAEMVDRVKSGIKSGEQANAAAYIAAIRDGCEAAKRIEDDIRLKNVQTGPFAKQVSDIIDIPTLEKNPKFFSGETFQLISLKYNPTAKQQPSWRALLKHGKEDIGISLWLEDAALLEYAAGVTIRETRHDILFDKPIDVILKYHEGRIFRLDSVYDGIEFINQDMKRKRLAESANQVLADIDKELMRV